MADSIMSFNSLVPSPVTKENTTKLIFLIPSKGKSDFNLARRTLLSDLIVTVVENQKEK